MKVNIRALKVCFVNNPRPRLKESHVQPIEFDTIDLIETGFFGE